VRAGEKQMLRNPIAYDTCHDEYNSCNKTMFAFLKDKHPTCQDSEAWLSWGHHFENSTVATMTWLTAMEYLIEEEQTLQLPKGKGQKDKQRSTKHTHKTKDQASQTPLRAGSELRCSGRVCSSCSTS
jgi:hypothetical protein